MVTAAIRSSTSMIGLDIPLNLNKASWLMFSTIFLVSATMAIVLYTAHSWASWYSGKSCHIKQSQLGWMCFLLYVLQTVNEASSHTSFYAMRPDCCLARPEPILSLALTVYFANITYFLESASFLRLCIHNLHLLFNNHSVLAYLREDFNHPLQKNKKRKKHLIFAFAIFHRKEFLNVILFTLPRLFLVVPLSHIAILSSVNGHFVFLLNSLHDGHHIGVCVLYFLVFLTCQTLEPSKRDTLHFCLHPSA